EAEKEIRQRSTQRQQLQQQSVEARVALAQVEERLQGMRARHERLEDDLRQGESEGQRAQRRVSGLQARLGESERTRLQAGANLADACLRKESAERHLAEGGRERDQQRQRRQQLAEQAQANRSSWRAQQEQVHTRELAVNDLRHHAQALCDRLQ